VNKGMEDTLVEDNPNRASMDCMYDRGREGWDELVVTKTIDEPSGSVQGPVER
jgi:hypothetical protein